MSFFAIPTLLGQAAIAAAVAGSAPLSIANMVVGDGNGSATTPLQTQTNLVNQRAVVAVNSIVRDPSTPTRVTVTAILDQYTGGFTVREAGLTDSGGNLLFVCNVPDTDKETLAEGVDDVLTLGMIIVVSSAATINLVVEGTAYLTLNQYNTLMTEYRTDIATPVRPYYISVISGSVAVAPASPSIGDTYVIPATATGVWSAYPLQVAQWMLAEDGVAAEWIYVDYPPQSIVGVEDVGDYWRRTASGWRSLFATNAEHVAGAATNLVANPAGVAAYVAAKLPGEMLFFLGCF